MLVRTSVRSLISSSEKYTLMNCLTAGSISGLRAEQEFVGVLDLLVERVFVGMVDEGQFPELAWGQAPGPDQLSQAVLDLLPVLGRVFHAGPHLSAIIDQLFREVHADELLDRGIHLRPSCRTGIRRRPRSPCRARLRRDT